MKILHINDFDSNGGAEVIFNLTYQLFKEKSIKFVLDENLSKSKIVRVISKYFFNPKLYFKLKKQIKSFNPDIIHLHNYNLAPITTLLAIKKHNSIQTVHASGQICPSAWGVYRQNYKKCNLKPNFRKCMRQCFFDKPIILREIYYLWHKFVVYLRKKIIRKFIFPSKALLQGFNLNGFKKLYLIRNPYPFIKKEEYTKKSNKENIILYVGKLIKIKGVDLLVKELIDLKINDWKFVFIGNGDLEQKLKHIAKKDKRFKFVGFVPHNEIKEYYQKSKIVIVSSIYFENYPTVILEALINDNLVIGTDRGGIPEMLSKEFIYNPLKKHDLNLKIKKIIKNYKTCYKKTTLLKKKFLINDTTKYAKKLEKIYKQNEQ